jgi:hypothetical protein
MRIMKADDTAMTAYAVKYDVLQEVLDAEAPSLADKQRRILDELPYSWEVHYFQMVTRRTWLAAIEYNGFSYHYDNYTHYEVHGLEPYSSVVEDRVIGVIGRSVPTVRNKKTATWLKGLVGPTQRVWGQESDKGHFHRPHPRWGHAAEHFPAAPRPQPRLVRRGKDISEHGEVLCSTSGNAGLSPTDLSGGGLSTGVVRLRLAQGRWKALGREIRQ